MVLYKGIWKGDIVMQNIKLLIAEENENNQSLITDYLQHEGYFNVIGRYDDESKILNTLKVVQIDILIINLFLKE